MAHFGMIQEHKHTLRKNRLFLLDKMNPEPVIQRLRQSNILTHLNMESIQAVCPTNYHKNEKVIDILPKRVVIKQTLSIGLFLFLYSTYSLLKTVLQYNH